MILGRGIISFLALITNSAGDNDQSFRPLSTLSIVFASTFKNPIFAVLWQHKKTLPRQLVLQKKQGGNMLSSRVGGQNREEMSPEAQNRDM